MRKLMFYLIMVALSAASLVGCGSPSNPGSTSGTSSSSSSSDSGTPPGGRDTETPAVCGNSKKEKGEVCDDGNTDAGDGCSADCKTVEEGFLCLQQGQPCVSKASLCGNGVIDEGEMCDDGNNHAGDGCSDTCQVESDKFMCETPGQPCTLNPCGNGVIDEGEVCDDGNAVGGDGCTANCKAIEEGYECIGAGSSSCSPKTCGDGKVDPKEDCDLGKGKNTGEYNGCRVTCKFGPRCGDGRVNKRFGETCDDGNTTSGDGCDANCKLEDPNEWFCRPGEPCKKNTCGDGTLDAGEACDDGNRTSGDGCSKDCTVVEPGWACLEGGKPCVSRKCGDGLVTGAEECDDKNLYGGDGCSAFCKVERGFVCEYNTTKKKSICRQTVCGDGLVESEEECDDKNNANGDGCSANCTIEVGYKCEYSATEKKSVCGHEVCGNGSKNGAEQCDDGNRTPGDGCDAQCQLEPGFKCDVDGQPCTKAECGNGVLEGLEQCDDNNRIAGDGCDPFCRIESIFSCNRDTGVCGPTCGDGITLVDAGEECDDGNLSNGDGCDAMCRKEKGFECTKFSTTELPAQIKLTLTVRDFKAYNGGKGHPDFEQGKTWRADTCHSAQIEAGNTGYGIGLLEDSLDSHGLPVLRKGDDPSKHGGACFGGQGYSGIKGVKDPAKQEANYQKAKAAFDQFYRDVPGVNKTLKTEIILKQQGKGNDTYVYTNENFFPIDNKGWGNEGWKHNYHFTTEFRTYFKYKGGERLQFVGDDDLWVFINGKLAVDLGGTRGRSTGEVTLSKTVSPLTGQVSDPRFDIYEGGVYEIAVFHAERQAYESHYKLTLAGFLNTGTSECVSVCGDGTFSPPFEQCDDNNRLDGDGCDANCNVEDNWFCTNEEGQPTTCQKVTCGDGVRQYPEQCDDGNTDDGDGCSSTCKHDHCGDGVLNDASSTPKGYEECDDGNTIDDDACSNDCYRNICGDFKVSSVEECDDGNTINTDYCTNECKLPICGDAIVGPGEQCDDGVNDGSYGSCFSDCTERSAYCGDNVVQASGGEECDEGARNGQGIYNVCSADCKLGRRCGDGALDKKFGEQCDDGNNDNDDGCDFECNIEPGYYCTGDEGEKSVCQSLG